MAKPLRLFTDGSYNRDDNVAGWGYVVVTGSTTLYAESGTVPWYYDQDSYMSEYWAILQALSVLTTERNLWLMTDFNAALNLNDPEYRVKRNERTRFIQEAIRCLCQRHGVTIKHTKSGKHNANVYADTIARKGCGLVSKCEMRKRAAKRKQIREQA